VFTKERFIRLFQIDRWSRYAKTATPASPRRKPALAKRGKRGPGQGSTTFFNSLPEKWADPKAVAALPFVFAHYDEADAWRAPQVTMMLFHRQAVETMDSLKYSHPSFAEERARELVEAMFSGRRRASAAG
jgi:hypothetical protein